jgi:hypothetical protein
MFAIRRGSRPACTGLIFSRPAPEMSSHPKSSQPHTSASQSARFENSTRSKPYSNIYLPTSREKAPIHDYHVQSTAPVLPVQCSPVCFRLVIGEKCDGFCGRIFESLLTSVYNFLHNWVARCFCFFRSVQVIGWQAGLDLLRKPAECTPLHIYSSSPLLLFVNLPNPLDALPSLGDVVKHLIPLNAPSKTTRHR